MAGGFYVKKGESWWGGGERAHVDSRGLLIVEIHLLEGKDGRTAERGGWNEFHQRVIWDVCSSKHACAHIQFRCSLPPLFITAKGMTD